MKSTRLPVFRKFGPGTMIGLASLLATSIPHDASALGIRLADQDAFATARGNAFAATADNPSAIYYNPAGISQIEGNNVRMGLYGIDFQSTYTAPSGAKFT